MTEASGSRDVEGAASPRFVEVAVPLPLSGALTYAVPERWRSLCEPGVRVVVPVGRRTRVGLVVAQHDDPPEDFDARELLEVVDAEPVLGGDLLELAAFVSDYYLAPIGEVIRTMVPAGLGSSRNRRVRLTDRGALALPRSEGERRLTEELLGDGPLSLADLRSRLGTGGLMAVRSMAARGQVRIESTSGSSGQRYQTAVELILDDRVELAERVGRSPKGRAVVELLLALGRPATLDELTSEVGCGPGVVRRLVELGLLRRFTQIRSLALDRHTLSRDGDDDAIVLREDQAQAAHDLVSAIADGGFAAFVLGGITGSGKTEVYLRALAACLEAGRSAIVMVPEIAMVPSIARDLRERFGREVAIFHSRLGRSEREQEWERLRAGEASIAVGPRSALFAPVRNLGLVVIDEEHDSSYKQDRAPRYNGRDLAMVRARSSDALAVLVSATPSLETRRNVDEGRYRELVLQERVGQGELPTGVLVDLRRERFAHRPGEVHFSEALLGEMTATLDRGEQVILMRNRRGYAPLLLCRACGEDLRCDDCGLPRTWHRRDRRLLCHYCGSTVPVPRACPRCGEESLQPIGSGTERVEEQVREHFPDIGVDTLDRDAVQRTGGAASILERFRQGRSRILVGTQMVSKGHHFPAVTLSVVLSADSYLGFPDFRAVERTYALLTQLAGRSGRGEVPGRVVIQTHHPDHYAIRAALEHDDQLFSAEEMRFRRTFHYPPFARAVLLVVQNARREVAEAKIRDLAVALDRSLAGGSRSSIRITGPAPAPLERLRGKWRFQLLLRARSGNALRRLIREAGVQDAGADVTVDVDPQHLL